jgi:hypothetical protein
MEERTYYDILGVSREATNEEITNAKNALAKVYHPDANMHANVDTTAYMQEILEAYRVLSNPDKRRMYDLKLSGGKERVFRTFTVGPEPTNESISFVTYWNAANKLQEIVRQSNTLFETSQAPKPFLWKLRKNWKHSSHRNDPKSPQLRLLSLKAKQHIQTLTLAQIPIQYWHPDAMNWVLIHWGQKQYLDFHTLFANYDAHLTHQEPPAEKQRIQLETKQFEESLNRLMEHAIPNKSV